MRKIFFLAMLVSAFVPLYAQSTHPEGLSFYNEKSHWGIVDVKGNTIIPFEFGNSLHFSEGLAPARKIRYLKDKNGITIAPARLMKVTKDNSQISRESPRKFAK